MKTLIRAVVLIIFWPLSAVVSYAFMLTNASTSNHHYYSNRGYNYVDFDFTATVHPYDGEDNSIHLGGCAPSDEFQIIYYVRTVDDSGRGTAGEFPMWRKSERHDPSASTMSFADFSRKIGLPGSSTHTVRLTEMKPGNIFVLQAYLQGDSGCYTLLNLPVNLTEVPETPPSCSAMVANHVAHGDIALPHILDEHRAMGRISVSCTSPALVTLTTGHTGTRVINSDLATEILIEGASNSATKTISTSDSFNVISRLHRTDDTGWSGSFNHSVPLTISWP